MKPLALTTLQLNALRSDAGQQAAAQTTMLVRLTLPFEDSNDGFLHFLVLSPEGPAAIEAGVDQKRSLKSGHSTSNWVVTNGINSGIENAKPLTRSPKSTDQIAGSSLDEMSSSSVR